MFCPNAAINLLFVAAARQLAKALEVPLVNDLGYTKRYVRCLQISEVVNSMKDLIDYSRETGTGPMESLAKFPRRTGGASSGFHNQAQQPDEQMQQPQAMPQNSNGGQSSAQTTAMPIPSGNGVGGVNNSLNMGSVSASTSTIVGLLHQNSMNSRQQTSLNNANSPYGGNSVQIPSPASSGTIPLTQPNHSPFQSPTPSSSNNPQQTSHGALPAANQINSTNSLANMPLQPPALSGDGDHGDSGSSVQKFIHEMMMSNQLNGTGGMVGIGSLGNDVKTVNGILPASNTTILNGGNSMVGSGTVNNSGMGGASFGNMGVALGQSAMANGIRAVMANNSLMNGRISMPSLVRDQTMNHQQDMGSQLLSGLGAANGFNNLQFDWKPSP